MKSLNFSDIRQTAFIFQANISDNSQILNFNFFFWKHQTYDVATRGTTNNLLHNTRNKQAD